MRRRLRGKQTVAERKLLPDQLARLRSLPRCMSTGRWQTSSSKLRAAQLLAMDRDRLEAEDFRALFTEWAVRGFVTDLFARRFFKFGKHMCCTDRHVEALRNEIRDALSAYPGTPANHGRYQMLRFRGWQSRTARVDPLPAAAQARQAAAAKLPSLGASSSSGSKALHTDNFLEESCVPSEPTLAVNLGMTQRRAVSETAGVCGARTAGMTSCNPMMCEYKYLRSTES